jgi:hypothetical protein
MSVKILVSAEANAGKTTLTKSLEDSLVISHDGKRYPFPVPHTLVTSFDTARELNDLVTEKIESYNEKFGSYPKAVVFDSVSKVFDTLYTYCNTRFDNFKIYSELDKEIGGFTSFIEQSLIASGINVVLISHALHDAETGKYSLGSKGSFAKRGGFLAEVDEAVFIELKNNKRILHLKSAKLPARSLQEDLPASMPLDEFSLQEHINLLAGTSATVDKFTI